MEGKIYETNLDSEIKPNYNLSFLVFLKHFLDKHRASLYFSEEGGKIVTHGILPLWTDLIFNSPAIYDSDYLSKDLDKGNLKCTLYSAEAKLRKTYIYPNGRYYRNIYVETQAYVLFVNLKFEKLERVSSTIRFEIYPDRIEIDEFLFKSFYSTSFKGAGVGGRLMYIFKHLAKLYELPISLTSTKDSEGFYKKEGFVEEAVDGKIKTIYRP